MSNNKSGGESIPTTSFVFLREATDADMALCMAWRSNPLVYAGFFTQQKPLTWEEHDAWWHSRNVDWWQFIVYLEQHSFNRPIGVVTIGQLDSWTPELGWYIGEVSLWGKGYGTEAVATALAWLESKGYKHCHTTVLKNNKASKALQKKLGFKYVCPARDGEERWEKQLG